MWINPSASQGQTTRIFASHAGLPGFGSFEITNTFALQYRQSFVIRASTAAGIVPANSWSHVAVTRSATDDFTRIYLNGVLVATSGAFAARYDNTGVIGGADGDSSGSNFNGLIDEVGLYNRDLSAAELESIFLAGSAGKCDPAFKLIPRARTLFTNGQLLLSTLGGTPPITFSLVANETGGTVDSASGFYTAGPTPGADVIRATDSTGLTADAAMVALASTCVAGQKTWDGGGTTNNWSEAVNWTCDQIPTSTENVFFTGLTSKNSVIDVPFTVRTIKIETGYKGTITQSAAFALFGTVSEPAFQNDGTFVCGGPAVVFQSVPLTVNGGTFNCGASDLIINGFSNFFMNGGTFIAPSGTFDLSAGFFMTGGTFNANGGTVIHRGTREFSVTSPGNTVTLNNYTVENAGQLSIAAATRIIVNGTFDFQAGRTDSGTIETRGAVNIAPSVQGGSATIAVTGDAPRTITIPSGAILPNLALNAPNVQIGTSGTGNINVRGMTVIQGSLNTGSAAFEIGFNFGVQNYTQSGGSVVCGGGPVTTVSLNFTMNGGVFDCGASPSLISQDGFLQMTINGGTFTAPSQLMRWNSSAVSGSLIVGVGGTFLHSTGTLEMRPNSFSLTNNNPNVSFNDLIVNVGNVFNGGGTVRVNNVQVLTGGVQVGNFDVRGNLSIAAAVTATNGASYIFSGTGEQTLSNASTRPFTAAFTVNKPSGTLTLQSDLVMAGNQFTQFTLTNGTITTGNFKVDAGINDVIRTNGHIIGSLRRTFTNFTDNSSRLFPVGTANGYSPVTANITTLSTNPSSLTIGAVQGPHPTLDSTISLRRYWPITEEGNLTATLTFNYFDTDVEGLETLYRVNRIANGVLDILTSPTATINTTTNTATVTGVTNFSDWTLSATPFPLVISPSSTTIDGGNQVTFSATGGQPGYTFSISQNNSGGSIDSTTGVYTAGLTGGVTDTVIVTDSLGNISQATVNVVDPFVVTNTNDTGLGSLRKALSNADNTPGTQTISFNIPGPGPYRIKLRTGISFFGTVTIDGTTQPGYAGTPIIEIDGSELGTIIPSSILMVVVSQNSTIKGLVFNRLPATLAGSTPLAIDIRDSGNVIQHCFIGTDVTGLVDLSLGNGLRLDSDDNVIGGTLPSERNVISGNNSGVVISGQSGNIIRGNYIGVGADGVTPVGNERAIIVIGNNNLIGGTEPGHGNVIANSNDSSSANGIRLDDELPQLPDLSYDGNTIRGNSIYNNNELGIDIRLPFGVNANDPCDADNGTNDQQNFPVITSATAVGNTIAIQGSLDSVANQTYDLDFFANDVAETNGHGEGKFYLGSAQVTTAGGCTVPFSISLNASVTAGQLITATATNAGGSTSEFGPAVAANVISITPTTVTNTDDSGPGSLRQAITIANSTPGTQTISFAILSGSAPHVIRLESDLPDISDPVVIDGTTQPGFAGVPVVQISGLPNNGRRVGFRLTGGSTTIKGLSITFIKSSTEPFGEAIDIRSSNNLIQGNYIGVRPNGTVGANLFGVSIRSGSDNLIGGPLPEDRNVISGNTSVGVINSGTNTTLRGNYIGVVPDGSQALSNFAGIDNRGLNLVLIRNVVSGNTREGVFLTQGANSLLEDNLIGLDAAGTAPLPNGRAGVFVANAVSTPSRLTKNRIASNGRLGIELGNLRLTNASGPALPNDPQDPDNGSNQLQNYPVVDVASSSGGNSNFRGSLNSTPNSTFTLEFFSSPVCDASGHGEGETFIGSTDVTTDSSGIAGFNVTLPVGVDNGRVITATATNPEGSTSEFSACRIVAPTSSISGRIIANSQPLPNTEVRLIGGVSATALTDANGDYTFPFLPHGQSYTVTPVKSGYTFSPASRTISNLSANQSGQDFSYTLIGFRLSGSVTTQFSGGTYPLAGVTLNLAGPANRTLTTDVSGSYTTNGLAPGAYTLTPVLEGYTFTPPVANIEITASDVMQPFIAATNLPGLTGRIAFQDTGSRIMNADLSSEVSLGSSFRNPALSRDGRRIAYDRLVNVVVNGVTRQRSRIFIANSDGTGATQLATTNGDWNDEQPAWSPDGTQIVFRRLGSPQRLVVFNMATNTESTIVDTAFSGTVRSPGFTFDGSGIVYHAEQPSQIGVFSVPLLSGQPTFRLPIGRDSAPAPSPTNDSIAVISNAATSSTISIFGTGGLVQTALVEKAFDVAWSPDGTLLAVSGQTTGKLYFIDTATGAIVAAVGNRVRRTLSWSVDPQLATPAGQNVIVNAGSVGVTFGSVSTEGTTTVTPIPSGSAGTVPGGFRISTMAFEISTTASVTPPIIVCFTVPSTIASTQTQFNALAILHNENGVLVDRTVSRNFATRQICAQVTSLSPFVLAEQVDAALPSITGLVRDSNGDPLSGVEVRLFGTVGGTAVTDADGVFSFVNLTSGGNYIVQPKQVGYSFTEYSETFVNLTANKTAVFVGTPGAFTLSGRTVMSGGAPIANVSIELSGDSNGFAVTEADGTFSFPGLPADGSYTVRPFGSGSVWVPGEETVESLIGDAATSDFVQFIPTSAPVMISGRVATSDGRAIGRVRMTLTDMDGNARSVLTSPFGYYTFDGVPGGGSYVLEASSKQYTFPDNPRLISAIADVTDADFLGNGVQRE